MEYIFLNNEIISLKNILNITIDEKENIIKINYLLENGKLINYNLDYSDKKIDPNKKETEIIKDYKKLKRILCKREVKNV